MPTIEEIRAQAEAEGITDEAKIQQRIAQAVNAGTITATPAVKPLVEYKPFSEMEEVPEISTGARILRDIGDIYTRYERSKDPVEMWKKGMEEKRQRAGEFWHEVTTGTAAPRKIKEAQAETATVEQEASAPATPSLLAPGGGEVSIMQQQVRPIPIPTTAGMQAAQAERQQGLEQQAADYGTALTKQTQQYEKLADLEAKTAEAARGVYEQRQRDYETFQTQRRQREERRQAFIQGEMTKVQDLVDQLQTSKIDPYSFYKHPDGSVNYPKSIASAIAVGLGALGSTLPAQYGGTGGTNLAMQYIDRAVQREIDAQREDIANQRAGVGIQMNVLSMARQITDDSRQQEATTELSLLKGAELMLAAQLARTGSPKAKANGELVMAQLQEKQANVIGGIINRANDLWVQDEEKKYMMASKTAEAMAKAQAPKMTPQTAAAPMGTEILPGYQPINQKEWEEDRKQVKTAAKAYYEAMGEIDKMIVWRSKYGAKISPEKLSEVKRIGNTHLRRAKSAMRKVDETGARLDPSEVEMMGLMENIAELGPVLAQLNTLKQSVTDKMNARIKLHGHKLKPTIIEGEAEAL